MQNPFPITYTKPLPQPPFHQHQWDSPHNKDEPVLTTMADFFPQQQRSFDSPSIPDSIAAELAHNPYFIGLKNKSSMSMDRTLVKDPNMMLYLNLLHTSAQAQNQQQKAAQTASNPLVMPHRLGNGPHTVQTTQMHLENNQYRRLYVGGFDSNFITEAILREIFKSFGPVEAVIFSPNKGPDTFPTTTNMGTSAYGFVQYEQVQSVYDALSCMGEYKVGQQVPRNFKIALPTNIRVESTFDLKNHPTLPRVRQQWALAVEVGHKYQLFPETTFEQLRVVFEQQSSGSKIYVGGLAPETSESDLHTIFSRIGTIVKISLIKGPDGGHKGYGFIDFAEAEAGTHAKAMDGQELRGKRLLVSDPRRDSGGAAGNAGGSGSHGDDSGSALVLFEYDLSHLLVPEPLADKYSQLPPLRPANVPSQNVRVANLYSLQAWMALTQSEQDTAARELQTDFMAFGEIRASKVVLESIELTPAQQQASSPTTQNAQTGPQSSDTGQPSDIQPPTPTTAGHTAQGQSSDDKVVCLYVQFSSVIEARKCILTVNNRHFEGRPVTATYEMKL